MAGSTPDDPDDLGHLFHEVGLLELTARDVHADLEIAELGPSVVPLLGLSA